MFLQISFPHPILAVESCPPCNIVLKAAMLIRTFLRKHTSVPTPLPLYHSWPAFPGPQRTDCWYAYSTLTVTGNLLRYFNSVFSGALFLSWSIPDMSPARIMLFCFKLLLMQQHNRYLAHIYCTSFLPFLNEFLGKKPHRFMKPFYITFLYKCLSEEMLLSLCII